MNASPCCAPVEFLPIDAIDESQSQKIKVYDEEVSMIGSLLKPCEQEQQDNQERQNNNYTPTESQLS